MGKKMNEKRKDFKTMKKLLKNKKGFTLMEMLIVVAIIVILVAVSMPVFTNQLDKSRKATDDANIRAAKAVAVATYLTADSTETWPKTYVYDAVNGVLHEQSTNEAKAITAYGKYSGHQRVVVTVNENGSISCKWNNE